MASRPPNSAGYRPETDGENFVQEFSGVHTLDVVSQAENVLKNECASLPQKIRRKLGSIARGSSNKPEKGWLKTEKALTTRTFVHVLQLMTDKAINNPSDYATIEFDEGVSFELMASNNNKYVVHARYQHSDIGLPTAYEVHHYNDYLAESARDITLNLKPSAIHSARLNHQNFALGSQTPKAPDETTHIRNVHSVMADLVQT